MKRKKWKVGKYSIRPAGKPDECFYCNEKVGSQHKKDCVIRVRTIVMDFSIRLVMEVPEFWTAEGMEQFYNNGSWCTSNLIQLLKAREVTNCLCGHTTAKYIKEATKEDEEKWEIVKVADAES